MRRGFRMPVIYTPKLSEVYRTTFFTIPSTFPGFISTGEVLVADGEGATVWAEITNTNVPIQTMYVKNTTSTNQLKTDYISAGTVIFNSANVPQTEVNTVSTGTITSGYFYTDSLSTNTLSSVSLGALQYTGSSIFTNQLSTALFQTNILKTSQFSADLISSGLVYATSTQSGSVLTNTISSGQFETTSAQFVSTFLSSVTIDMATTEFISSGTVTAPNTTVQTLFASTINGQKYPLGPLITPTPQFSTVSIENTISSFSTLTNTVSAGTLLARLASMSSLSTDELYAPSGSIPFAQIGSLNVRTVYTTSTTALSLITEQINTNITSTNSITSQVANIQSLSTNTLATNRVDVLNTRATQVYAQTVTADKTSLETLQTNFLSTQSLSTGSAVVLSASTDLLYLNSLSSAIVLAPSTCISLASAASQFTAFITRADEISAATVLAPQASTVAAFVSSLNGAPYPVVFAVNSNLQLSTMTVRDTMTVPSTLTTINSSGTLNTSLRASSVYTNSISTGTINAISATFLTTSSDALNTNTLSNVITTADSTILYGTAQVSTLLAETANLSTLSTGIATTLQLTAINSIQTPALFINNLSSGIIGATTMTAQTVAATTVQSATANVSSLVGQTLFVNQISTAQAHIEFLTTSTLNTNTLNGQGINVTTTTVLDSQSTVSISTNTVAVTTINTNMLLASTLSTVTASISSATAATATIRFLSAPTTRYPPNFSISTINVNNISSASAEINYIDTYFLTADSFTFNDIITRFGIVEYSSTTQLTITSLNMNNDIAYTYTNTAYSSNISTVYLDYQTARMSSINAAVVVSQTDTHDLANTNIFKVDTLITNAVTINSVLAGSASTNTISTVYSEGGHAQFYTLETSQTQTQSTLAIIVSTGHVTADTISTHTITIWGPNTLLVQGNTILDGVVEQSGDMFIKSLETRTLSLNTLSSISSITLGSAQTSSVNVNTIIGSAFSATTVNTVAVDADQYDSQRMNASTVNAYGVSTVYFTVDAIYGSTLTIYSFTTLSTITQVDTLTVAELSADYLAINETLSTTTAEIKTLGAAEIVAASVSTTTISTGSIQFGSLFLQTLQTSTLSSGFISTSGDTNIRSVITNTIDTTELNLRNARGIYTSTGTYTTTTARISTLNTTTMSTGIVSTGILVANNARFDTLSTNSLIPSSIYAQLATLVSVNTNFISAGNARIQSTVIQTLYAANLNFNTITIGGNNIAIDSLSTNLFSTSQMFGGGIFLGQNVSTNAISSLNLTINTMYTSSFFAGTVSVGQLWTSTINISSLNLVTTEAKIATIVPVIRPVNTNIDILSTGTIFGSTLNARLNTLSSAAVSTNSFIGLSASITFLSSTNIAIPSFLTADQAIFANTIIRQLSTGIITPTSNFFVNGLSTNFISSATISSAVGNIESLSTLGISTNIVRVGNLFISSISTGFLRANTITIQDLSVSSINGQTTLLRAASTMTVRNTSQSAFLSTAYLSTQYMQVRGSVNIIPFLSVTNQLVIGIQQTPGSGGANRLSFSDNNGRTWSAANFTNIGEDNAFNTIIHNGEYYLATKRCVLGSSPSNQTIIKSFNGSNWTASAINNMYNNQAPNNQGAKGVKWNGRFWVATGDATGIASIKYSFDGSNWNNSASAPSDTASSYDLAWNGNQWIVTTGSSKKLYTSRDGSNWTELTSLTGISDTTSIGPIIWTGKMWLMGTTNTDPLKSIKYSYNGYNWNNMVSGTGFTNCKRLGWNGDVFVAVGEVANAANFKQTIQYSYDGSNWLLPTTIPGFLTTTGNGGHNVIWTGEYWAASGAVNDTTGFLRSSVQLAYNPETWSTIGPSGTGNGSTPLALGCSIPLRPNLTVGNIDFYTQYVPTYYNNSHQIFTTASTLQIDSFAIIKRDTNQFIINTNLYQNSTASLIVNSTIFCRGDAFKPGGGQWTRPSDRRIKEDIQIANYEQCYTTMKNIPLYHYTFTESYRNAANLRDQSVLGFIAQEVSNYFPKAVDIIPAYGFSDLHVLNHDQLHAMHYGATRHLITMNEQHRREFSSFYTSTLGNMPHYISSIPQSFITLEQEYSQISTMMAVEAAQRYATYESTIASHFITISTLNGYYESLSTLVAARAPSQPPQEGV